MQDSAKDQLLDAMLMHVPFDGWSEASFKAAIADAGVEASAARGRYPRGAIDLAIAFHKRGDAQMISRMKRADLLSMRYRDRVALAVRYRLEAIGSHKEAVRRGSALFALPHHAADGAKLIWGTADAIWTALGDSSDDYNWYTKRATLSGVYASSVLYWLGDTSTDNAETWAFVDRRIGDVMQVEQIKAQVNANPVASRLMAGPNWLLSRLKPPARMPDPDLPGHMNKRSDS